jgi:cytochrome bd-type quinol oxidase subunit 1
MTVLLDRWQFGVTITYHFLFVPLTIGLAFLVAIMQVLFGLPAQGRGLGAAHP